MKIIEQSHEILRYDDLAIIERAGRTCYKSESKIGCKVPVEKCKYWIDSPEHFEYIGPPANLDGSCAVTTCEHHSAQKFVRQLIKRGHEAMLEHGGATVRFVTNRGVTHELVRHRVASFGQESTRYVKYDGEMEFIRPVWFQTDCEPLTEWGVPGQPPYTPQAEASFAMYCAGVESQYKRLIDLGWRPEQAREVLPNSLKTEIVITANYREWRHIMKLRAIGTTGKPHPQMQALMLPLLAEFKEKLPVLFENINFGGEVECV